MIYSKEMSKYWQREKKNEEGSGGWAKEIAEAGPAIGEALFLNQHLRQCLKVRLGPVIWCLWALTETETGQPSFPNPK